MHQVNNHGVSGRWFTETDVKHFKSGALRTITKYNEETEAKNYFTGLFQRFCS